MTAVKRVFDLRVAIALMLLVFPSVTFAQHYSETDLVSSIPGRGNATDARLINAWGLTRSATSPWWVSDNGTGLSTLYNGVGTRQALIVTIPVPADVSQLSAPTGVVFNGTATDFLLPGGTAARFIFVTEEGTIVGWMSPTTPAVIAKDNSKTGAVYKGCTIAELDGNHYLFVTNFHSGAIEVYDSTFTRVTLDKHAFAADAAADFDVDHDHRGGESDGHRGTFAPFNVQAIGTNLYVTYAKQGPEKKDEVDGAGLGFVNVFSTAGKRLAHLQHGSWFNAPWGVALAPGEFGEFSHSLLVGMFGSGQIAAFNPVNGRFLGLMKKPDDSTLAIDGLWALGFGAGNTNSGPYNTLYFTAGPNDEGDGTFGTLVPTTPELVEVDEP